MPEGDYPEIVIPYLNDDPKLGEPILTATKPYVGDFSPNIKSINGKLWSGWFSLNTERMTQQ